MKNVKKLLRNFEYTKSQKAKELSVLRLDLSFLQKNVYKAVQKLNSSKNVV